MLRLLLTNYHLNGVQQRYPFFVYRSWGSAYCMCAFDVCSAYCMCACDVCVMCMRAYTHEYGPYVYELCICNVCINQYDV